MDVFDRVHRAFVLCCNELAAQLFCTLTALVRASFALLLVTRRLSAERKSSAKSRRRVGCIAWFAAELVLSKVTHRFWLSAFTCYDVVYNFGNRKRDSTCGSHL